MINLVKGSIPVTTDYYKLLEYLEDLSRDGVRGRTVVHWRKLLSSFSKVHHKSQSYHSLELS